MAGRGCNTEHATGGAVGAVGADRALAPRSPSARGRRHTARTAMRVIASSAEFDALALALDDANAPAVLVVFGSKPCRHCPQIKTAIVALQNEYAFETVYVDAHEHGDITERFEVTQLPALLLKNTLHQAVRSEAAAREIVADSFKPIFTQAVDF